MSQRQKTKYSGVFYRTSVTAGKADKTYYIRYKDEKNKTYEIKVGKYSEGIRENYCNQKRIEILNANRLGEEPPAIAKKKKKQGILFEELASFYFTQKKVHWAKGSYQRNQSLYRLHIAPSVIDLPADMINKAFLLELQTKKLEAGLAQKTVNNIIAFITAILNYALEHEKLQMIVPTVRKFHIDNTRERYLTLDEIQGLYEAVEDHDDLYTFCKLALSTGARISSLLNIKKMDINFENRQINIKDYKNKSTYKAFLTPELSSLLRQKTAKMKPICYVLGGQTEPIWDTTIQKPLRQILNDLFNQHLRADDRKNRVVIHTLRHTFASHLAINGTPIYTIQKLMNHKDINMTLRYAKLAPDTGRNFVEGLYV